MSVLARLLAGQLVTVLLLALARIMWPGTAAQVESGLRTFAFAVAGIVGVLLATLAVSLYRNQRQPPYLQGRNPHA